MPIYRDPPYHPGKDPKPEWMRQPTYPLELDNCLHICLWSEDHKTRASIAYFEDSELKFVGDRPLDKRVNWEHFRLLAELGYKLMETKNGLEADGSE